MFVLKDSPEFALALQSGKCTLKWTECTSMPTATYGARATVIGCTMYIGCGLCPNQINNLNVYAYHLEENRWSCLPPLQDYPGNLVSINENLTVIGGHRVTTNKAINNVTTFINSSWESDVTPNLLTARKFPGAVSYRTYTIVVGGKGADGNDLSSIEVFDITTHQWTLVRGYLPQPMYSPGLAVCGESLIIIGYDCKRSVRSNMASIISIAEIIRSQTNSTSASFTTEDSESVNWKSLPEPPFWRGDPIPDCCPPVLIGGDDLHGDVYNDVTLYDDTEKVWKKVSSSPFSCAYPTVIQINKAVIVVGGTTNVFSVESAIASSLNKVVIGHFEFKK